MIVCLVGNPNCGKTTLFNTMTGATLPTGNRSGVTVTAKTAPCKGSPDITVADTPGTLSLDGYSPEEIVTARYLAEARPDVIVSVVDATALKRSLQLTCRLLTKGVPTVVALNMSDEAAKQGIEIDVDGLSARLGAEVVPIVATRTADSARVIAACRRATPPHKTLPSFDDTADGTRLLRLKVNEITSQTVRLLPANKDILRARARTDYIDGILLNRWLALPLFCAVMWAIFRLCLQGVGGLLSGAISNLLAPAVTNAVANFLSQTGEPLLVSLVCDGALTGIFSVVAFLPQIVLLSACMTLLEESGYLARVAFATDKFLRPLGLCGQSLVCLTVGCGCSVPAVLSTRTLKDDKQRCATACLAPFVPCSAKLTVISFFSATFFDGNATITLLLYLACILAAICAASIPKIVTRRRKTMVADSLFLLELPPYRLPRVQCVVKQCRTSALNFLTRAGTTVFVGSVALWVLQAFDWHLQAVSVQQSILADVGRFVSPCFAPLGFDDMGFGWAYSVATLAGLSAKETIQSTLAVLCAEPTATISTAGAFAFVLYNLLTIPCVATVAALASEQGKARAVKALLLQSMLAYLFAFVAYCVAMFRM